MALTLPNRPAEYFIKSILLPAWRPSEARGFDATVADPSDEAFLPTATTIDDVGAVYPSLIVTYSSEVSGGESTYDFLTPEGPGQRRAGELVVTARAQDSEAGYAASGREPIDAEDIVVELVQAVENLVQRNATGGTSDFSTLGSQRGPNVPDDLDEDPPVRLADTQVSYSWPRTP